MTQKTYTQSSEEISLALIAGLARNRRNTLKMSAHPIVGMFYRPPAKALMDVLRNGTPLTLIAEPDNDFDPNAIAVWLYSRDIPEGAAHAQLLETLPPFGFTLDKVLAEEAWQLGYVKKEMAKELREADLVPIDNPVEGVLVFSPSGAPMVRLSPGEHT